jgi:hypothetical protein
LSAACLLLRSATILFPLLRPALFIDLFLHRGEALLFPFDLRAFRRRSDGARIGLRRLHLGVACLPPGSSNSRNSAMPFFIGSALSARRRSASSIGSGRAAFTAVNPA